MFILIYPYKDTQAQDFMSAEENCGGLCLLGIQPGKTRVGETMKQLQTHAWVRDLRQDASGNGYSTISWEWSGNQPAVIDPTRQGRITFYWVDEDIIRLEESVIETITIYTRIPHYSLQEWLGETEGGAATSRPDGKLGYSVLYDIEGGILNLYAEMRCPFSLIDYWNTKTRITLSIGRSNSEFVQLTELSHSCKIQFK